MCSQVALKAFHFKAHLYPQSEFPCFQPSLCGQSLQSDRATGCEEAEQLKPEWKTGWCSTNLEAEGAEEDLEVPATPAPSAECSFRPEEQRRAMCLGCLGRGAEGASVGQMATAQPWPSPLCRACTVTCQRGGHPSTVQFRARWCRDPCQPLRGSQIHRHSTT